MNAILKIYNRVTDFRSSFCDTRIANRNKMEVAKSKKLENEVKQLELREELNKRKLFIQYDKSIKRKSFTYKFVSTVATLVSIIMSVCGITNIDSLSQLLNPVNAVLTIMMTFISFTVWTISFNSDYIRKKFYNNYKKLKSLQTLVIIISVVSNFKFLQSVIHASTTFDYLYITCFSVAFDIASLTFSQLSQDCKYNNYSTTQETLDDNKSFFEMLTFLFTYKIKMLVRDKYETACKIYKNELNEVYESQPAIPNFNENEYKQIKYRLNNYNEHDVITSNMLGINDNKWRKYKPKLIADNLLYLDNRRAKKSPPSFA